MEKQFDVVIWGASGFTGRLVAEYMFKRYGYNKNLRWAMAGRSKEKLESVRAQVANDQIPIIIADSQDTESLNQMLAQTKVVCTTVGPYAKYGTKLVQACIAHQVHYCDLAGEVQWMRKMIDDHHADAVKSKTKIVHTCGFDSIPSDMGVYFLQEEYKKKFGSYAPRIDMRVRAMKGGMSGGTYASLSNVMAEARKDKSIYKTLLNPYGLNPTNEQSGPDDPDLAKVVYDPISKNWIFPFIMAGINTKVVRRSNALSDYVYGKDFRYSEAMMAGDGIKGRVKATSAAAGLAMIMAPKPGSFMRKIVDNRLPDPGEGPSITERENGFYNLKFYCSERDELKAIGTVTGDRDPGYGSTSKMLAECAISLAKDQWPNTYGMLTPAIAMGDQILNRLQENAGLGFSVKWI